MVCSGEDQKWISHVIFDMDGTIINTVECYWIALQNVTSRYEMKLPDELKVLEFGTFDDMSAYFSNAFPQLDMKQLMSDFKQVSFSFSYIIIIIIIIIIIFIFIIIP